MMFAKPLIATLALLALATPALAEQRLAPQRVTTHNGQSTHIGEFYSLMPDCTLVPGDSFRVVKAPEHGKVTMVRSKVVVQFVPPNPAARCRGQKVMSTNAVYTPVKGFYGVDSVELEVLIHDGGRVLMPVLIGVAKH